MELPLYDRAKVCVPTVRELVLADAKPLAIAGAARVVPSTAIVSVPLVGVDPSVPATVPPRVEAWPTYSGVEDC